MGTLKEYQCVNSLRDRHLNSRGQVRESYKRVTASHPCEAVTYPTN